MNREIDRIVFEAGTWLQQQCHSAVSDVSKDDLARYARLDAACNALQSFIGIRPPDDDDVFAELSSRRRVIADKLGTANLDARLRELGDGLYLAIPYFTHCSDKTAYLGG